MARPLKVLKLDEEQIRHLAAVGCSHEDIAAVAGVSVDTLTRRFAEILKIGGAELNNRLRAAQVERALAGSDTMLIWLGKVRLRQIEPRLEADTSEPPALNVNIHHIYPDEKKEPSEA